MPTFYRLSQCTVRRVFHSQSYLNHGDFIGDQAVADDHIALLDVKTLLSHRSGDEEVDLPMAELVQDILLLGLAQKDKNNITSKGSCFQTCTESLNLSLPINGDRPAYWQQDRRKRTCSVEKGNTKQTRRIKTRRGLCKATQASCTTSLKSLFVCF